MTKFELPEGAELQDFSLRDEEERADLLSYTWCNECAEADLGMENEVEYSKDERVFLSGQCKKCGAVITTEIIDGEDESEWQE